jgi:hypothetical protein
MAADWARPAPAGADLDRPSVARMYDCFLGGAHNVQVDRDGADGPPVNGCGPPSTARVNPEGGTEW